MDKSIIAVAVGVGAVGLGLGIGYRANRPAPAPVVQTTPSQHTCTLSPVHMSTYSPSHPIDDGPTKDMWLCDGEVAKNQDELTQRAAGARTVMAP